MNPPLVKVKEGALKGTFLETEFGQFMSFNGIPYAEPPIGELRYTDPQPHKPWSGVREAITEGEVSSQIYFLNMKSIGSDDCLYLNVTTKNTSGKRPVMVWIHGGGFTSGSGNSDLYRGDYLVQHDIVYVSINYRLGMLGFLNMDLENCSGNQGLKDQVLALKWVQENIEAFGGDKNNVTIFGESAGSASVHYLCISPLAKGLFHKAIAQSGVTVDCWASHTSNKENAMKVAAELGCSSTDAKEVLQFLRKIPADTILKTQNKVFDEHPLKPDFQFVPTVDIKCPKPFLPKPMSEMLNNGIDVPLIIGYTSHEGIFTLGTAGVEESCKNLNDDFDKVLWKDLKRCDLNTVSQFSKEVRKFYFGEKPITKEQLDGFIQYKSDVYIVAGILYILEKQFQRKSPTYLYKFSHCPEISLIQTILKTNVKGACHADELTHLFYKTAFPENMQLQKGTMDYLVMQRMTKIWTDFAKTGNPTPENNEIVEVKWTPYNAKEKMCLHLGDNLRTEENFQEKCWKLWKPIFDKFKLF